MRPGITSTCHVYHSTVYHRVPPHLDLPAVNMLNDLPPEILLIILPHLENHRDRWNFTTLTPRFYAILRRSFYTDITLFKTEDDILYEGHDFFQTITKSPELADAVQVLELRSWEHRSHVPTGGLRSNRRDLDVDDDLLKNLVEESGIIDEDDPESKHFLGCLKVGLNDAWLALLLPRLRNLRKISIDWAYDAYFVPNMLFAAVAQHKEQPSEAPFKHLQEAYAIDYYSESGRADTRYMHPFFSFPSMQKIGGFGLWEPDDEEPLGASELDDVSLANYRDKTIMPKFCSSITCRSEYEQCFEWNERLASSLPRSEVFQVYCQ